MQESRVDFTIFFRKLGEFKQNQELQESIRSLFVNRQSFDDWSINYKRRLLKENSIDSERKIRMDQVNPKYILRNYLLQNAIDKAKKDDFSEVERLKLILRNPYSEQPEFE